MCMIPFHSIPSHLCLQDGCFAPLRDWMALRGLIFASTTLGVAVVELVVFAISILYCVRLCQSPYAAARRQASKSSKQADAVAAGGEGGADGEGEQLVQAGTLESTTKEAPPLDQGAVVEQAPVEIEHIT